MKQEILLPETDIIQHINLEEPVSSHGTADELIREMRQAAKRAKRAIAGGWPMVILGMLLTIFVSSRYDIRLSLTIFAVVCGIVIAGLIRARYRWERFADRAIELGDVRAIGPLLWVWSSGDDSARESIENALIHLLPNVSRLSQLSESARKGVNRILTQEEGFRSGSQRPYNADLVAVALETVSRIRDCRSLHGVRRLAEGYGPRYPVARLRDLAQSILPDLEERSALLRPSTPVEQTPESLLRAAANSTSMDTTEYLRSSDAMSVPSTAQRRAAENTENYGAQAGVTCADVTVDPGSPAAGTYQTSRRVTTCESVEPVEVCSPAPFC